MSIYTTNETINLSIRDGNTDDGIKALQIGAERFTIDIIACNHEHKRCAFRINGKPTGGIYTQSIPEQPNAIQLNQNYILKIESATFNYCNNQRFCNYHFEAYDIINIKITPAEQQR